MIKPLLHCLLTTIILGITGCSFDPNYEAEKALWEVKKIERSLSQSNPDGLKKEHYYQIIAALRQVSKVAPSGPLAAQAQFRIAQIYVGLEEQDKAHETLKSIFIHFSEDKEIAAQAAYLSGKLYQTQDQMDQAMSQYTAIMRHCPMTKIGLEMPIHIIRYHKEQGANLKMNEAIANARKHYESLINDYSGTSVTKQIYPYILQVYDLEKAWDDMLTFWDSEIEKRIKRSDIIEANLGKADVLASRINNYAEAEKIYQSLISNFPFEPKVAKARFRLAHLQVINSNLDEARKNFQAILTDTQGNEQLHIQSYLGLAMVDHKEAKHEDAVARYDHILAEFPNHPAALNVPFVKYHYYLNIDEKAKAQEALEAAVATYSAQWIQNQTTQTDQVVGQLLFQCLIQQENWDTAVSHLEAFTQRFPNESHLHNLLVALYQEEPDNPEKALQTFSGNMQTVQAMQPPM